MGKLYLCMAWAIALCLSCQTSASILIFEDLDFDQNISGDEYEQIKWNSSSLPGVNRIPGDWICNSYNPADSSFGTHCLVNSYGCIQISFEFPQTYYPDGVTVNGAYFNGMGDEDNWPYLLRATGLMDNSEVWTVLLSDITADPKWLAMNEIKPVEKIVITVASKHQYDPKSNIYGYFGMDNLTFEEFIVPEPMTLLLLTLGAVFIRRR